MRTRGGLTLCVVACKADEEILLKSHVISTATEEGAGHDFDIPDLVTTQYIKDANLHATKLYVQTFYYDYQEEDIDVIPGLTHALQERPSAIVLIVGPYARGSSTLSRIIDYVRSLNDLDDTTEFLVVGFSNGEQIVAHIGRSTCVTVPKKPSPRESYDGRWHISLCQAFAGALKEVEENQSPEPNVGVGGLLLDAGGRFFLARRHAGVGRDRYVTFGGILLRGMSISDALAKYASEQLKLPPEEFSFGLMLSCTNMLRGRNHFVDLTYLTLAHTSAVGVDGRRHAPINPKSAVDDSEGYWYSFKDMIRHYESGRLFRPVANAFESYCLWALDKEFARAFPAIHSSTRYDRRSVSSEFDSLPGVSIRDLIGFAKRVKCNEESPFFFESLL